MRTVRCGVIGAGWWGTYAHVPALLEHSGAELVALQTRELENARRLAAQFGVARAFSAAEDLLALEELDAVVISSAPHLHYRQARAALLRGLHVLVEKPMTLTAAEACDLVELAAAGGLHLLISCPWHYTAHGRAARALVRQGALGEPRLISVLMTNPVAHLIRGQGSEPTYGEPLLEPERATYSDPAVAGGGQSYAQVSHVAAYLVFLTGAQPARVFARYHNDGAALDIYNALDLQMDDGCLATVASTGATARDRRDYEVRLFGTDAMLFLDLWKGTMEMVPLNGGAPTLYAPLGRAEIYPERAPARNLVDAVLGVEENLSPGTLGLAAMEILEAGAVSAREGRDVVLRLQ